jgi:hypothetical protein
VQKIDEIHIFNFKNINSYNLIVINKMLYRRLILKKLMDKVKKEIEKLFWKYFKYISRSKEYLALLKLQLLKNLQNDKRSVIKI